MPAALPIREDVSASELRAFARREGKGRVSSTDGRRLQLWFQDEARIGQKGRISHLWWERGQRPVGLCDKGFTSAYLYAAVCPAIVVADVR